MCAPMGSQLNARVHLRRRTRDPCCRRRTPRAFVRCNDSFGGGAWRDQGFPARAAGATLGRTAYPEPMPTIRGIPGPYRLYFYSFDCNEPPHVHVQRERATAEFWLDGVALAGNHGLAPRDLTAARRTVLEHLPRILEAWREHCGSARE